MTSFYFRNGQKTSFFKGTVFLGCAICNSTLKYYTYFKVFKEDDLISKPGEEFNYTTHGFTLLSAAIESISGEKFTKHMKKLFKDLGLSHTYLDENEPIIPNRAKFYDRNEDQGPTVRQVHVLAKLISTEDMNLITARLKRKSRLAATGVKKVGTLQRRTSIRLAVTRI